MLWRDGFIQRERERDMFRFQIYMYYDIVKFKKNNKGNENFQFCKGCFQCYNFWREKVSKGNLFCMMLN